MSQDASENFSAAAAGGGSVRAPAWRKFVAPAVLAIAGLAAYANSFDAPFVFDGEFFILRQPAILTFWRVPGGQNRPIGFLSFAANYAVGGFDVRGYHAVNLLIHVAAAWLLFDLVRRTLLRPRLADRFGDHAWGLGLAAALVWLVHPLQTESVTYIYQRLESLMALFYLATLWCYVRGADARDPGNWYAAGVVCCALGMGTKEVMVTAPLVVIWYDHVFIASSWREVWQRRARDYAVLCGTWLVLAVLVARVSGNFQKAGVLLVKNVSPLQYALSEPAVILHYLRLAFWPDALCLDYGWPVATDPSEIWPPALALAALVLLAAWAVYRWPAAGFLAGSFFLILAPTSSIAPLADLAFEHRMYLPLAPLVTLVVTVGFRAWQLLVARVTSWDMRSWPVRLAPGLLLLALVAILGCLTVRRNENYRSALALWKDTAGKRPNNYRAHLNLGTELVNRHDLAGAIHQLNLAAGLEGQKTEVYFNRGAAYFMLGDDQRALDDLNQAIAMRPSYAEAFLYRARVHVRQDQRDAAIADYGRAIGAKPDYGEAYYRRAVCLAENGAYASALADAQAAARLGQTIDPRFIEQLREAMSQK